MYRNRKYLPSDKMSDLICDNYSLLQVLSRFELPLGFGDASVKEVCEKNNVDCTTFLAVINFISEDNDRMDSEDIKGLSIHSLMSYLKQAHVYFLNFQLPSIRKKLIKALDNSEKNDVDFLILKFFDAYVSEVRRHMEFENTMVFTYVENLLAGRSTDDFCISNFARKHTKIEDTLTELKNIIIKYYPSKKNNNLLNAVLFDIFSCEKDLISHNRVEDFMFVPIVLKLEKEGR